MTRRRRSGARGAEFIFALTIFSFFFLLPLSVSGQVGISITPPIPGDFDPEEDLRAKQPMRLVAEESPAPLAYRHLLFRYETEYDSTAQLYIARQYLFNSPVGLTKYYSAEEHLDYRVQRQRKSLLKEEFASSLRSTPMTGSGEGLEIQVPFKIKSKTFRRIFGGDRVGLRVSGQITIDGGLRREKSDQVVTTQNDRANYNFKLDQTQQFKIIGKVGDKVSVEIDQDSERLFEFENAVKLTYTGEEDEIIQSIEAGNVNMSLPGTQLATMTAKNEGLFGFKTVAKVGPLSITALASLQKGEKNKRTFSGGSEAQSNEIRDTEFISNQYFFLDKNFRDTYPRFASDMARYASPVQIIQAKVYKKVNIIAGDNQTYYEGLAMYDPPANLPTDQDELRQLIDELYTDELQSDPMAYMGFWQEVDESDYYLSLESGYIRLNSRIMDSDVLAVAFSLTSPFPDDVAGRVEWGSVNPEGTNVILRLIKPETPHPRNPTWQLAWRNVYWMRTTDLKDDDFELKIVRLYPEKKETNDDGIPWVEVFGLDRRGNDGTSTPDGLIDPEYVNFHYGEVAFPDLRPFDQDPENPYTIGGDPAIIDLPDELRNPNIYYSDGGGQAKVPDSTGENYTTVNVQNNFALEAKYSNQSANISLGFNILEGSEEVFLNGVMLKRDVDYIIDYLSGQVTILNEGATAAGAKLEINYESGEILQLDKKTMVGVRVEYSLWEDSFIGGTLLYFNEKPLDRRVKVGQEPTRNLIWDLNTRIRFEPYFMTRMVDALPLIATDEPSRLTFEGEIAQVFPNPNSLNSEATGDPDGVAYVDDFESSKRATPLGVMRKSWYPASHPVKIPLNDMQFTEDDYRSRMFWFNPHEQVKIQDIWPNREVNSKVAPSVHVLNITIDPRKNNFRDQTVDASETWNGVMRWLSSGYNDQTNTKFIEIWMKWTSAGTNATMYVDMGEVSEDVIPNGKLDTEDKPIEGFSVGNGILDVDKGEDTGLDGRGGYDPPWDWDASGYDYASEQYDWWDINGNDLHDPDEPFSSDNWAYNRGAYENVNGTEGNSNDESGLFPDTEDLDRNSTLNQANNFFRYRFRLSHKTPGQEDFDKYIVGGKDNPAGWRLVRIPIEDVYDEIGSPDLTQIKYLRIWFTGLTGPTNIQLAQFELAGNEWLEELTVNPVTSDTTLLSASVINTYDNPEVYNPPPGVMGEIDPIYDIRSKEQSLVIKVHSLPSGSEGQVVKNLLGSQKHSYLEYKRLKMYVNGGGTHPDNLNGRDLVMFFRFGSGLEGANKGYYEYVQRLNRGWEGNEIIVDIDRLTRLKKQAEETGLAYEVLPNGDVLKVIGEPSLGSIKAYAIGLRNFGNAIKDEDNVEIWVDELRLSGVRKEPGMALRSSIDAEFADFLELHADLSQQDADFHRVDQRTSTSGSKSNLSTNINGTIQLGKFIDPTLGISIPLSGTMRHKLEIPKYATSNSDIRTESIAGNKNLSVWQNFMNMAFNRDFMKDRYLYNENGDLVMDTLKGNLVPKQNLSQWGIDTLFSVSQEYSWRTSIKKSSKSNNPIIRYTIDNLSPSFSHSQKYSSSLRNQYQKNFTNTAKLGYRLSFPKADLRIFGITEKVPIIKKLADTRFNYWPKQLSYTVDGTERRSSSKLRNALDTYAYSATMKRSFSTGFSPFNSLNFDYNFDVNAEMVKEDSTRQQILYSDQPDSLRRLTFAPGASRRVIIGETIASYRKLLDTIVDPDSIELVDSLVTDLVQDSIDADEGLKSWEDVVNEVVWDIDFYDLRARASQEEPIRLPWNRIDENDPKFTSRFLTIAGMHFLETNKNQRVSANYNPNFTNWLTTSFNYSANYSWKWQNRAYTNRSVTSGSSMGANFVFKLKQLLPKAKKNAGGRNNSSARNRRSERNKDDPKLSAEQFGQDDKKKKEGDGETKAKIPFRIPNPLYLLLSAGQKIQDIRLDYNQNMNYFTPGVVDGTAKLKYQLGLTGDPGLATAQGAVGTATSNRNDEFRLRSGVDWSSRISSTLDYSLRFDRSSGNKTTGSETRNAFLLFNADGVTPVLFDIPNWTLRWSGIEQIGPISKFAQSVTMEHSYNGSVSSNWEEQLITSGTGEEQVRLLEKRTTRENIERTFSPLVGFNITWKYGISSQFRYNNSTKLVVEPIKDTRSRDSSKGLNFSLNYTRKTGFRIPIPVWPFKNRRFNNETTFTMSYDQTSTLKEVQKGDSPFEKSTESKSWSVMPSIRYSFSRNVNGSIRYKYGSTQTATNKTTYMEFGINVNISIRG